MKCPSCEVELKMTDREGIEIDYCPQCRGVWLDRGELDKVIERSAVRGSYEADDDDRGRPPYHGGYRKDYDDDDYRRSKHRRGFWSNLFDFD